MNAFPNGSSIYLLWFLKRACSACDFSQLWHRREPTCFPTQPKKKHIQGDHLELSQKLLMITFKEKRICQAAILHIVDVFSPFDNNTPTSSNKLLLNVH